MSTTWRKTLTAAAACFALALSGCGSDSANENDPSGETSSPAPTSAAPDPTEAPEPQEDASERDVRALIEGVQINGNEPHLLSDAEVEETLNLAKTAGEGLGLEVEPAGCKELLNAASQALSEVDPATINMAMALVIESGDSIVARTSDALIEKNITEFDQQLAQCNQMTVKIGDMETTSSMSKLDVSDISGVDHVIGMSSTIDVEGVTQTTVSLQAIKDGIVVVVNGADTANLEAYKDTMREVLSRI